jgi:hypothetical protein
MAWSLRGENPETVWGWTPNHIALVCYQRCAVRVATNDATGERKAKMKWYWRQLAPSVFHRKRRRLAGGGASGLHLAPPALLRLKSFALWGVFFFFFF